MIICAVTASVGTSAEESKSMHGPALIVEHAPVPVIWTLLLCCAGCGHSPLAFASSCGATYKR